MPQKQTVRRRPIPLLLYTFRLHKTTFYQHNILFWPQNVSKTLIYGPIFWPKKKVATSLFYLYYIFFSVLCYTCFLSFDYSSWAATIFLEAPFLYIITSDTTKTALFRAKYFIRTWSRGVMSKTWKHRMIKYWRMSVSRRTFKDILEWYGTCPKIDFILGVITTVNAKL